MLPSFSEVEFQRWLYPIFNQLKIRTFRCYEPPYSYENLVAWSFKNLNAKIEVKFLAASKVKNWTRAVKLVPRSLVDEAKSEIWSNSICARGRVCQECDRQWKSAFVK